MIKFNSRKSLNKTTVVNVSKIMLSNLLSNKDLIYIESIYINKDEFPQYLYA